MAGETERQRIDLLAAWRELRKLDAEEHALPPNSPERAALRARIVAQRRVIQHIADSPLLAPMERLEELKREWETARADIARTAIGSPAQEDALRRAVASSDEYARLVLEAVDGQRYDPSRGAKRDATR
jgi:hypothetical protein